MVDRLAGVPDRRAARAEAIGADPPRAVRALVNGVGMMDIGQGMDGLAVPRAVRALVNGVATMVPTMDGLEVPRAVRALVNGVATMVPTTEAMMMHGQVSAHDMNLSIYLNLKYIQLL